MDDQIDIEIFADSVFNGFLSGQILDSAIIGILCYIGCSIFKIPYAMLVSVIVGITNVIPFSIVRVPILYRFWKIIDEYS